MIFKYVVLRGAPPSGQDREVDAALLAVLNKVQGVKGTLSSFVGKMEQGPLTW